MEILMASHGSFARALKESAEMITGPQPHITTFELFPDMSLDDFQQQLAQAIQNCEGEVLVLLDLLGGTPFNTLISQLKNEHVGFITGMNLGMLLELLLDNEVKTLQELQEFAKCKGIASIVTKEDVFH